jgi:hypothetical protein
MQFDTRRKGSLQPGMKHSLPVALMDRHLSHS